MNLLIKNISELLDIALNHGYHIVNNILRKRGKIFSHTEKFSKSE